MSDAILQAWIEQPKARPVLHVPPSLSTAMLFRIALAIGLLGALVTLVLIVATMYLSARPVAVGSAQTAAIPSEPTWIDIVKPVRIYSLEARDLAKLPLTYAARRRRVGEARDDILTYGAWRTGQPSLRLSLMRNGAGSGDSLDTDIVRQAAEVGLSVGRSKLPETLPTRFGTFEIADVETESAGMAMQCSGFRLWIAKPSLVMHGFACGAQGRAIARHSLACLIDRLDLASAGEDRALSDFFAATDLKRNARCDGMRLAPDVMHAAWLDEKELPAPPPSERHGTRRRH